MIAANLHSLHAAFFDNAEIHFMLFDKDLNILDVNEATLRFYHITKDQLVGKHILEVTPDAKEKGLYSKYREVIDTGKSIIIEDIVSHSKFGNQHNRIKAFKVGDGLGAAAINITELKTTIESLEFFILQSSHDLRSPIANMQGLASLALMKKDNIDECLTYCSMIKEQAERTNAIITKLVETIKVKNENEKKQQINFYQLIDEVKKSLSYVDGFSEVNFVQNIISDQKFYSDRSNIVSLFQNLTDNAIKYRNNKTDSPCINITVADDVSGIKITFSDNGIGIPEHLQKNVFSMFFRATEKKDSMGLGLYTVQNIVKKLNGHIAFSSKEMAGTTFTVYIPNGEQKEVLSDCAKQNENYL